MEFLAGFRLDAGNKRWLYRKVFGGTKGCLQFPSANDETLTQMRRDENFATHPFNVWECHGLTIFVVIGVVFFSLPAIAILLGLYSIFRGTSINGIGTSCELGVGPIG